MLSFCIATTLTVIVLVALFAYVIQLVNRACNEMVGRFLGW
jgi:hypothetical protein